MEEDLDISENGRWPYFLKDDIISWKPLKIKKIMQPRTIKKNIGCGTAPGNLVI